MLNLYCKKNNLVYFTLQKQKKIFKGKNLIIFFKNLRDIILFKIFIKKFLNKYVENLILINLVYYSKSLNKNKSNLKFFSEILNYKKLNLLNKKEFAIISVVKKLVFIYNNCYNL